MVRCFPPFRPRLAASEELLLGRRRRALLMLLLRGMLMLLLRSGLAAAATPQALLPRDAELGLAVDPAVCRGDAVEPAVLEQMSTDLLDHRQRMFEVMEGSSAAPVVMLTITTAEVACMHDNFLQLLAKAVPNQHLVALNLDETAQAMCTRVRTDTAIQHCVDLASWYPSSASEGDEQPTDNSGYQTCAYHLAVATKPMLFRLALQSRIEVMLQSTGHDANASVLMLDSDVVVTGDIGSWLHLNKPHEALLATAQQPYKPVDSADVPSTGFVFATDNRSTPLLDAWIGAVVTSDSFVGVDHELIEVLNRPEWAGSVFTAPREIWGEKAAPASHATHYNGGVEKVRALALEHRWVPSAPECAFDPKSTTSTRMPG